MPYKNKNAACEKALMKLAAGDNEALSRLYDIIGKRVYFIAYSVLGNHFDAEDAAQQTFLEILKCAKSYSGGGAYSWITSVAYNQAHKILRKRKSEQELDDAEETEFYDTDAAERLTLRDALDRLPPEDRRIVTLHVLCDMRYAEIAAETGTTEAAIQKRYARAIEKIKKYYGKR